MCESSFTLDMLIQALIAGVCERLELGCQRRLQLQPPSPGPFWFSFFFNGNFFFFFYGGQKKGDGGGGEWRCPTFLKLGMKNGIWLQEAPAKGTTPCEYRNMKRLQLARRAFWASEPGSPPLFQRLWLR